MTRHFFHVVVVCLFIPLSVAAEPLILQSGEHANFTRLVTPLPIGATWQVTHQDDQVVLNIEGHKQGFDATSVFDRIPRNRISEIATGPDHINLTLECDCTVATFLERDQFIVIDVAAKGVTLAGTPIIRDVEQVTADANPVKEAARTQRDFPPLPLSSPTSTFHFPEHVFERSDISKKEQSVLAEMQLRLARELGSAATRGILIPNPDMRTLPASESIREARLPSLVAPMPVPSMLGPLGNVRISSSLDLPETKIEDGTVMSVAGVSCPPKGSLDISNWGNADAFTAQISDARKGLFGELNRIDKQVATKLAQRYLYFGFGAEARQVLELDTALAEQQSSLLILADILDGKQPKNTTALVYQSTCDPEVALWTILTLPDTPTGALPDADAALRALNKLPDHLRQILAPALSKKLLAYGQEQSAGLALRSLERLPFPLPSAAKIAQAKIDLHTGQTESGTAQLEDAANDNGEHSPAALIALIDAKISAGQPIDPDTLSLVAAYAQELRTTNYGPDLQRAHILALLQSGQFDLAFQASEDLLNGDDADHQQAIRIQILRALTASADDIVFLDHIFAQRASNIAQIPSTDVIALAARMLKLGFPRQAESALATLPDQPPIPNQQLLAARIALAMDKPHKAQASLLGLSGDAAQNLRADAKRMVGAHDEAHKLYSQIARPQEAAETAWLAEDWRSLTPADTPVFGAASTLVDNAIEASTDTIGMLARTAETLDESTAARATLTDLLSVTELPARITN